MGAPRRIIPLLVGAMLWRCGGQVTWDEPLASGGSGAQWPADASLGGYGAAGPVGGAPPMGGRAAYGSYPNLIYETFNEPELVDWSTTVKPYHQAVVAAIREVDPDNLIVLGSPEWCQRPDEAAADPVAGSNLAYALHFYACSHGQGIREQGEAALSGRLALFVTEWGATGYDGGLDGIVCEADAALWHDWMDARSISWTAWKFDDCTPDSTCILREDAPLDGGYTDEWLHGHGPFVRDRMLD